MSDFGCANLTQSRVPPTLDWLLLEMINICGILGLQSDAMLSDVISSDL